MTDSWWLKFKRAQRHMVELRHISRLYAQSDPYKIVRIRNPKGKRNLWRYKITFDPPDQMIFMVLGDFIHNLRTALDHVVVACTPPRERRHAGFPITLEDLWQTGSDGNFAHPDSERREDFERAIRGLPRVAQAQIIVAQPYQGQSPFSHVIGVLGRLENADKHRELIPLGLGLRSGHIVVVSRGIVQTVFHIPDDKFFQDNAQILSFSVQSKSIKESDVQVQASGTATIHIKVVRPGGPKDMIELSLLPFVLKALNNVRFLLRILERNAIRA